MSVQGQPKNSTMADLWDLAINYTLGETLKNGRLADSGWTEEDRIRLRPPAED